jgi:hypothetical protein
MSLGSRGLCSVVARLEPHVGKERARVAGGWWLVYEYEYEYEYE